MSNADPTETVDVNPVAADRRAYVAGYDGRGA